MCTHLIFSSNLFRQQQNSSFYLSSARNLHIIVNSGPTAPAEQSLLPAAPVSMIFSFLSDAYPSTDRYTIALSRNSHQLLLQWLSGASLDESYENGRLTAAGRGIEAVKSIVQSRINVQGALALRLPAVELTLQLSTHRYRLARLRSLHRVVFYHRLSTLLLWKLSTQRQS